MAERDPAQALDLDDLGDRLAVERKHLMQAGVEQQRLLAAHKEGVEGKAGRRRDLRHIGREPENAVGDFSDLGFHNVLRRLAAASAALYFTVQMCVLK
jgi:hypothetical protein